MTQAYRCCEHAKEIQNDSKVFSHKNFQHRSDACSLKVIGNFIRASLAPQTLRRREPPTPSTRASLALYAAGIDRVKSIHAAHDSPK
jgi:hypothetical protein